MAQSQKSGSGAKKKKPAAKSAPRKTGTSRSSGTKKNTASRSSAKRKTSAAKTAQKAAKSAGAAGNRQVGAIILFAVALFLLFVALIPGGNVWAALQTVLFGVFGVIAYVIPLLLIYVAIMTSLERDTVNLRSKIIETVVLICLICAAVDIFGGSGPNPNYGEAVSDAFWNARTDHNGGAIGALIGDALMILFGSKVPAGITVIILIFVMVMLLSGTTLIRLFRSLWAPVQKAGTATSEHFEERARASEERRIRREEEQAARRGYRQVDIDLGPDPSKAVIVDDLSDEDFALLMQRREQSRKKKTSGGKKAPAREPSNPKTANIYAFQSEDGFDGGTPTTKKRTVKKAADPTKATKAELDAAAAAADAMIAAENAAKEPAPQVRLDDIIKKASQRNAPATETSEATAEPAAKPSTPAAESATASPDTPAAAGEKPPYKLPPLDCLKPPKLNLGGTSEQELRENAEKLVSVLESFGVKTTIVDIERGPSVTRYELSPAPGVKISRITGLADDIALNLAASEVRIEAPIPGKAAVGIEVPNKTRETVTLREILEAPDYQKKAKKSRLTVALGRDIAGNVCMTDIAKMPHLLIAGTTGSGKSVCLNAMILSILYNATPDEVKLVMIDPKQVEFSVYNGIPHLLVPVVSDPHKASGSLAWAVKEMMNRYKTFSENNVRDIKGYNELAAMDPDKPPMPQIVIFIDELADLMMVTPAEVEDSICRLAQLARAAGMHLVVATQRPSVDVITGLIKANIPSRLSLSVSSAVDSRTILDMAGAEKLLGNGDMLFNPIGNSKPTRIQGCFTSDAEVEEVVDFIKNQEESEYSDEILEEIEKEAAAAENNNKKGSGGVNDPGGDQSDALISDAIQCVVETGQASTTLIQRKLRVGYARAARIVDELEERGIIGPFEGSKPRKVLITKQQWLEMNAMAPDGGVDAATAAAIDLGVEDHPES